VDQRTGRNGPKIWHDALTRILCQYFGKKSAKVWGKKDDMNARGIFLAFAALNGSGECNWLLTL